MRVIVCCSFITDLKDILQLLESSTIECMLDWFYSEKSPCFRCCVRLPKQLAQLTQATAAFSQLHFTRLLSSGQWALRKPRGSDSSRFDPTTFRFLSARLLPGPSKEPDWEYSVKESGIKFVWFKTISFFVSPGKLVKSQRLIWAINGEEISSDWAEFRELVRSAVDILAVDSNRWV